MEVLIKRANKSKLKTGVYRKATSSDIYINWNTHIGALRNLVKLAKLICSNESLVKNEIPNESIP